MKDKYNKEKQSIARFQAQTTSKTFCWFASLALCFALLLGTPHIGQAQKKKKSNVIQLEEIKIEGQVQKPNAFYILNRSRLGYELLDLRTRMIPKIVRSTRKKPF